MSVDAANYRRNLEPHADRKAGLEALRDFSAGVADLRNRHRIANVVLSAEVMVCERGDEVPVSTLQTLGGEVRAAFLAAGAARTIREELERALLAAAEGER